MPGQGARFTWYELMTTDMAGASAFYTAVLGWRSADAGMPGLGYTVVSAGDVPVGGLMPMPEHAAGMRPGWSGYLGVEDVDEAAARLSDAGGAVHRAPSDIPGVGRFAVVSDPQGAGFVLFRGLDGQTPPPSAPGTPGHGAWHELHAADLDSAWAFYAGQFGWTKGEAVDMGPMGVYQLFNAGDAEIGGMMTKHAAVPAPFWLYYFAVPAIEDAAARVRDAGGTITQGPHPVPGGSWIVQCRDPQGATFALVAPPMAPPVPPPA